MLMSNWEKKERNGLAQLFHFTLKNARCIAIARMGSCLATYTPPKDEADETAPLQAPAQTYGTMVRSLPDGACVLIKDDGTSVFFGPNGCAVVSKNAHGNWRVNSSAAPEPPLRTSPKLLRKPPPGYE